MHTKRREWLAVFAVDFKSLSMTIRRSLSLWEWDFSKKDARILVHLKTIRGGVFYDRGSPYFFS